MDLIWNRTNQDLIDDTDKAYISYIDLNRIENACIELADLLGVKGLNTKTWVMSDYRTDSEMKRMHDNIKLLMNSYYANPKSPRLPDTFTYTSIIQANNIEECLYRIQEIYNSVQSGVPKLAFKLGNKPLGNK